MVAMDESIVDLIRARIENLRPKLLDLSRRNPLISTKFSPRSNSHIRVVDELPDVLFSILGKQQKMRFVPLPSLEDDPRDEQTREFQNALTNARLTDEIYIAAVDAIDPSSEVALEENRHLERQLRDRIREVFGMPSHQRAHDLSLAQHAKNNGISPHFELPTPSEEHQDGRHSDTDIQTLILPKDLERKMNGLMSKCRSWAQETGINVLHAAFGFLEWSEANGRGSSFAPLILSAVELEKKKALEGTEFWVSGKGEEPETNMVLGEMLRRDYGIELPMFEGGSAEDYFSEVAKISPNTLNWKVRRQVAFGVFPSARMAMYHDLDTADGFIEQNEVIAKLFGGSAIDGATPSFADEYDVDSPEIEKKVPYLVMDADSSQFSAMVDVANGKNLAVEGPPGTGKSQTIVNVIAAALAEGKKILFVAEKKAALDVVKSRLEAVGMGEFILPLLAGGSSREQVIQSLRDRVEMKADRAPNDFEAKVGKFRQVRSELAAYIDVISTPFGSTGFTVHEILGKSIATADLLADKSNSLRYPEISAVERIDKTRIVELRESGDTVEEAWISAELAKPYWSGHNIQNIDKFLAEKVCGLAAGTSTLFKVAVESRAKLVAFNIHQEAAPADLKKLRQVLKLLEPLMSSLDVALIGAVCRRSLIPNLSKFLEGCRQVQIAQSHFSTIFSDSMDTSWGERIRSIHEFCSSQRIDTLDIKMLESRRFKTSERLEQFKDNYRKLRLFVEVYPDSSRYGLGQLKKAHDVVSNTRREILALRNDTTADPVAVEVILRTGEQGRYLLEAKDQLEAVISAPHEISPNELIEHAVTIQSARFFSILSPTYRAAKRAYLKLSRRGSFDKKMAVEDLRSLADWKDMERVLVSDEQAKTIFGAHFKGIGTSFDLFDQLVEYFMFIEQNFHGPANMEIRKFLKTGDLDIVQSIPEISISDWDGFFPELQSEIERQQIQLSKFDSVIERLSLLVKGLINPSKLGVSSLIQLADDFDAVLRKKTSLNNNNEMKELLKDRFEGSATKAELFANDLTAIEAVISVQERSSVVLRLLEDNQVSLAILTIETSLIKDEEAKAALEALCLQIGIDISHFVGKRTQSEVSSFLEAASLDHDGLRIHSTYAVTLGEFEKKGFGWITSDLLKQGLPLEKLGVIIEAVIIRAMAMAVYQKFGEILTRCSGTKLDELRANLASLDRQIIETSRKHLRAKLYQSASPPNGISTGRKSRLTEMGLVNNEIGKIQRFIAPRDLIGRAGKSLLELKPCWMMSPLAVAQYIPKGALTFDLCIIDEASQMTPEDAVGALVRSGQTMVVGDTNQLPPTNFFRKMIDDEDVDEDEKVLEESILEMANAVFRPARRLRWHYRSRDSSLIKFSNHMVYDDSLIVFPSANENRSGMGVSLVSVDGLYHSGTNSDEAAKMVDAAIQFMRTDQDRSLGIVTLNQKQRDLLQEEMDYAISSDDIASSYVEKWSEKNNGLESFFIKNLENVQGDERDVIFIGTVYGPEQLGSPVMQRFGPINGVGGKRRLNVLFSRAKQQIITFSSMTPVDIRADENGNAGVYMLKRWLEYSATGSLHTGDRPNGEPDSPFEEFVIAQIQSMGCTPVSQVGVKGYSIDIGIKHPQWPHGFVMAVECDGATYHSSKSARDRDRLRQQVLEGLGWHFHRIWSTDWFNDPVKEADRLRQAIELRLEQLLRESASFGNDPQPNELK